MQSPDNKLMRRRLFGAWVSTVISISLVLLLVGVASLLLLNALPKRMQLLIVRTILKE